MTGLGRVIYFNWPRYAVAVAVATAGFLVPVPAGLAPMIRGGAGLVAAAIALSLVVTWWVYDHSPLYGWRWLTDLLPAPPGRYAVVSSGLDEISPTLRERFPAGRAARVDLFDPAVTREGSIRRARAHVPPVGDELFGRPDAIPLADRSQDAVFVVFAAHELRTPDQRGALFAELSRVLRPGGSLLLVEHFRDLANIAAFGPGAWHFYPRAVWLGLGRGAHLATVAEAKMTPFVRALVFRRGESS